MSKKMLINASQLSEIRIAVTYNQLLYDLEIEDKNRGQNKGNIYKGIVTKIEQGLDAIFIDYGSKKQGFLPFKEISDEYFYGNMDDENFCIKKFIYVGLELIIQVIKEERKNKGAALTTYLSLAGCYIVLMPNNSKTDGISRHIKGKERFELKEILNKINIPKNMGIIIRTASIGKNIRELEWELSILLYQFKIIRRLSLKKNYPSLLYQEGNLIMRAIRDHLKFNISDIIVDDFNTFRIIRRHLRVIRPDFMNKVKFYSDENLPLFSKYKIETQIELAFKREVFLPSGGSIIIDNTEALISIDVNSAKATRCNDIETTAFQTNLEAVDEIVRQLRIRDLSGLIIIDFIDMYDASNQKKIEKLLKEKLSQDKAKVQVGKISKFGLLEVSRQRLKKFINDYSEYLCNKCDGTGKVGNMDMLSSNILRVIEEESTNHNVEQINIELPTEMIMYIMNKKKLALFHIEKCRNIKIIMITNLYLSISDYKIFKIKLNEKYKPKQKLKIKENLFNNINNEHIVLINYILKFLYIFIYKNLCI